MPQRRLTTVQFTVGRPTVFDLPPIGELLEVLGVSHGRSLVHVEAVGVAAGKLARTIGLSDDDIELAQIIGVLHDIGKIAVPSQHLDDHMTIESVADMRDSIARASHRILVNEAPLQAFAPLVFEVFQLGHTDYEVVEVVRLCDEFDAMTRWTPYRSGYGMDEAVELLQQSGRHSAELIDALAAARTTVEKELCLS